MVEPFRRLWATLNGTNVGRQASSAWGTGSESKWQTTHRVRIVELTPAEKRKDRLKSKFRLPVLEMLIRNVGTIGLEGTPGFGDELEAMEKEKLESRAVYNERDGFGWRFHSCISNVRREWRHCYRVNGHALHMSDVANSQPLVLASILRERGVQGCDEYVQLCEEGTIYDTAAKDVGTSRQEAKDGIIHHAFYGRNSYGGKPYRTKWHRWLRDRFPAVADFVKDVKRTDYARLSRMLQRQESKIVLYTACESLVLEEDVLPCAYPRRPVVPARAQGDRRRAHQAGFRQIRRRRERQARVVREKRG